MDLVPITVSTSEVFPKVPTIQFYQFFLILGDLLLNDLISNEIGELNCFLLIFSCWVHLNLARTSIFLCGQQFPFGLITRVTLLR